MAAPPAQPVQGDDTPLLASPAPHVGTDVTSPDVSAAWKRLLVNSPPAWAASPEALKSSASSAAQRIPPFPWPSPNIRIFGPGSAEPMHRDLTQETQQVPSSEDEEEIARFLSHCSLESEGQLGLGHVPWRTPSPRRRLSLGTNSFTWTPAQIESCGGNSPTVGSGTTMDSAHRARSALDIGETPDANTTVSVSPGLFASPGGQRELLPDASRAPPERRAEQVEPEVQVPLRSCSCCGRRFRASRLPVHEDICFSNAQKKRSVFESSRQRCEAVSGRWWSECEDVRSSTAQSSACRSPPQARRDSKISPGMRRSHSTPLNRSRHVPTSPPKATPSPARPTRQVWAGGQKPSPSCSPNKVSASSSRRPRSVSEVRGHAGGSSNIRQAREARASTSRRAVSLGRSSSASAHRHSDGSGSRAGRVAQAACPGTTASTTFGFDKGVAQPSWGSVPAMPVTPEKGPGLKASQSRCGPHQSVIDAHVKNVAHGSMLGSIIDDVAQLSAQVERLLSRRKDLLQSAGEFLPSWRSGFANERASEVLELSPSDSSTAHGGESCRSRF